MQSCDRRSRNRGARSGRIRFLVHAVAISSETSRIGGEAFAAEGYWDGSSRILVNEVIPVLRFSAARYSLPRSLDPNDVQAA